MHPVRPIELELPLVDAPATPLARLRIDHVRALGITESEMVRLVRGFPSLASVYGATQEELSRLVGAAAAARIRWFLDAPLDTRLAVDTPAAAAPAQVPAVLRLPHAA